MLINILVLNPPSAGEECACCYDGDQISKTWFIKSRELYARVSRVALSCNFKNFE